MTKRKALLILGGGAARGLAHIGAVSAIEEHFDIRGVIGCSIGSIVGAMVCLGKCCDEMMEMAADPEAHRIFSPLNLDRTIRGIFNGRAVLNLFRKWTDSADISDMQKPFLAVTYDLVTHRTLLIDRGPVADAMRASSSIPIIFAPFSYGRHICIDGGVEHPLPIAFKDRISADVVIAVNVLPRIDNSVAIADPDAPPITSKVKISRYEVMVQALMQNQSYLALQEIIAYEPDIVIDCAMPEGKAFAFDKASEYYEYGRHRSMKTLANYQEPGFMARIKRHYREFLCRDITPDRN
jgi:NTE family protein